MSANRLRTQIDRYCRERIRLGVLGVLPWGASQARTIRLAILPLLVLTGACGQKVAPEEPAVPNLPARRASASFIHCVEQTGAQCISINRKFGGWDAFSVLGWLAHGNANADGHPNGRVLAGDVDGRALNDPAEAACGLQGLRSAGIGGDYQKFLTAAPAPEGEPDFHRPDLFKQVNIHEGGLTFHKPQ